MRINYVGELGWELHCAEADQVALYGQLLAAAREVGAGPVGARALGSLRIEKGYGSWGREYTPEYWPQESGLDRLVRTDKGAFLNRDAYVGLAQRPARARLVMLKVEADGTDATGGEPIFLPDGTPVGHVSSGAYGYFVGMSLAMGYVETGRATPGDRLTVAILGRDHDAILLDRPPFDADGERLRA